MDESAKGKNFNCGRRDGGIGGGDERYQFLWYNSNYMVVEVAPVVRHVFEGGGPFLPGQCERECLARALADDLAEVQRQELRLMGGEGVGLVDEVRCQVGEDGVPRASLMRGGQVIGGEIPLDTGTCPVMGEMAERMRGAMVGDGEMPGHCYHLVPAWLQLTDGFGIGSRRPVVLDEPRNVGVGDDPPGYVAVATGCGRWLVDSGQLMTLEEAERLQGEMDLGSDE